MSQNLTMESLLRPGIDGRLQPLVADSWSVAKDGLSVAVHVRSGVKFYDGSPLDPPTLAALLPDALRSLMGTLFDDIEGVSVDGPEHVVIRFRKPSPFLLESLEATVRKSGPSGAGTGPFGAVPGMAMELQSNDAYYLGRPQVSRVVVSNYPTVRAAWADLLRDRLDMLYEVGIDALDSMQGSSNVSVFTVTRPYQHVVLLNTQAPALRSRELRRALNLAVDKAAFVKEALNGHGIPSRGPVSPRYWALSPDAPTVEHNPNEAARLMTTGHLGADGRNAPKVRFTCLVPPDAVTERVALTLKRQLQQFGVDMILEEASLERILELTARREYDAALTEAISGPTLLRAYYFWHSNTPFNSGGWGSPVIDAALDRARNVTSEKEYIEAVGALQRTFVEDPPAIFLAWSVRARAVSKRFVVPEVDPDRDVLSTLRLWKPAPADLRASRN